jgi:lipoprotein-anchoring transpeptidase ErfK/SrfK
MNTRFNDARLAVEKAREALRNGNRTEAREWAEHAASLAPQMEDPWLILAAVASPRASVEYIRTALKINPNSPRARRGMEWAMQRLRDNPQPESIADTGAPAQSPKGRESKPATKRNLLIPILLFGLGCLIICGAAVWSARSLPVLAFLTNNPAPTETHPQVWAQAEIPKPTYTPPSFVESQATPTPQLLLQPTIGPTETSAALPTETPLPPQNTELPANTPMPTPQNTELPTSSSVPSQQNTESAPLPTATSSGSISMSIVPDTPIAGGSTNVPLPTAESTPKTEIPPQVASNGERWIDVNLTQQMVYAYQGNSLAKSFLVSTGTWQYPTVTGQYHIYIKLRYTDMTGPGYYLPNVPFTMYFYQSYGLHGTYWHHNFGTPMSHGCVNLSIPDSEWLYNWASVGTLVNVHY